MGLRSTGVAKLLVAAALGVVAAAGGFYLQQILKSRDADTVLVSDSAQLQAPQARGPIEFSLPDTDGVLRSSGEWAGKLLFVNFWATWCAPCREEIPVFIELQSEYAGQGLQFVGVALDDLKNVTTYAKRFGINYPILLGEREAIELGRRFGNSLGVLPFTVAVDTKGTVVFRKAGKVTRPDMESVIREHL